MPSGTTRKIKGTTTFRAISYRRGNLGIVYSDTTTVTFVLGKTLGKPYFSTNRNDSFSVTSKVGIGGFGKDDTVRYTTDGGDPTRDNSKIYSPADSILVQSSQTIIAKSFSGGNSSPTCTTQVKLNALTPVFSAKSGTYTSQIRLSIKSPSGIVPVYYTTDGSTPTNQSLKAGDTLYIDSNVTIKAVAILPGWNSSRLDSAVYRFKVATPVLSFKTGNYDTTQILSITDSAAGAKIHYTTNGSSASCGSTLYNPDSSLRLDSNLTIKAIACKDGWVTSDTATGNYTFKVAKISFSPDSGIFRDFQTVRLSTRSPGVALYVTRDSSAPSWNASGDPTGTTQKINPGDTLSVRRSQWIRVVAARNGWANSTPDSRRYVVEGDTLLIDDFEQNSLTNPIGRDWRFWSCGTCVSTAMANEMSTTTDTTNPDWNRQIGFRNGHIAFHIPSTGAVRGSDAQSGPGYAGYSVGVPSSLMGETYRIVFWARWKPGATNPSVTSVPLVTEMVWKNNDQQNGAYDDGFQRYVDTIGTSWRRFILDYAAFYPAGNAYDYVLETDSTSTNPKSYWLFNFPDSARMIRMGLSKFQGWVVHSSAWGPHWTWGADHDHWNKSTITNFRWSILQPNSDTARLARLGSHQTILDYYKDTLVDSTYRTGGGTDTTVHVTHKTPVYSYCGDCHSPGEPTFSEALKAGFSNLDGSLELDRIQLVRRPQVSGGTVVTTKSDTTSSTK